MARTLIQGVRAGENSLEMVEPRQRRVTIGVVAVALLAAAVPWAVFISLGATPCGVDGIGFLQGSTNCPLKPKHVLSAVFGGLGLAADGLAVLSGLGYAALGHQPWRRAFVYLIRATGILLFLWFIFAFAH